MSLGQILIGNHPDLGKNRTEGIWSEFDAMVNSSNPTHLQLHALAMSEQANPADTLTGKLCALFNRLPLMRNAFTAMMLTKQPIMLQHDSQACGRPPTLQSSARSSPTRSAWSPASAPSAPATTQLSRCSGSSFLTKLVHRFDQLRSSDFHGCRSVTTSRHPV